MATFFYRTLLGAVAGLVLVSCAQQPPLPGPISPEPAPAPAAPVVPRVGTAAPPAATAPSMEAYKALVAQAIWRQAPAVYSSPIPDMLKSIVVLEITVDRAGNPIDLQVYRSNGYRHLESRALESVVRAAPFPSPAPELLGGAGEVTFLETFLFRDDDHFQLRTLAALSGV